MKIALIEVSHWHAPLYLEALISMGLPVAAVSDADPAVAERVAGRLGCRAYGNDASMLEEVRPDFVFAFGRHRDMPSIARRLVGLGIPFAMEKPMGISAAEVEAIRRLVERSAAFVAVPLVFRTSPIREAIDELRSAGKFGDPTNGYFRFIAGPPSRYVTSHCDWMLDPELSGGGCTINLGVHFIDLALDLFGARRVERVYAIPSRRNFGTAVEDFSTVVLSADDGTVCTVETAYAYPSDPVHPRHLEYCVTTTKGYLEIREGALCWAGRDGSRIERTIVTDTDFYYRLFVERTLRDLAEKRRPVASVAEMVRVMELVDAAYRSGREGQAVRP